MSELLRCSWYSHSSEEFESSDFYFITLLISLIEVFSAFVRQLVRFLLRHIVNVIEQKSYERRMQKCSLSTADSNRSGSYKNESLEKTVATSTRNKKTLWNSVVWRDKRPLTDRFNWCLMLISWMGSAFLCISHRRHPTGLRSSHCDNNCVIVLQNERLTATANRLTFTYCDEVVCFCECGICERPPLRRPFWGGTIWSHLGTDFRYL